MDLGGIHGCKGTSLLHGYCVTIIKVSYSVIMCRSDLATFAPQMVYSLLDRYHYTDLIRGSKHVSRVLLASAEAQELLLPLVMICCRSDLLQQLVLAPEEYKGQGDMKLISKHTQHTPEMITAIRRARDIPTLTPQCISRIPGDFPGMSYAPYLTTS